MYGGVKVKTIEERARDHAGQDAGVDRHRPERLLQNRERQTVLYL